jgi:hypothetical protein
VGLQERGESHDELSENPSKTSMSQRPDFSNSLLFSLFSGNPDLERVLERRDVRASLLPRIVGKGAI